MGVPETHRLPGVSEVARKKPEKVALTVEEVVPEDAEGPGTPADTIVSRGPSARPSQ